MFKITTMRDSLNTGYLKLYDFPDIRLSFEKVDKLKIRIKEIRFSTGYVGLITRL